MSVVFYSDTSVQSNVAFTNTTGLSTMNNTNNKFLYNSGIYNPSNNEIRFFNNSIDTITLTSGNNVGIGKTNPSYKLDVNGNIGATNLYGNGYNLTNINYANISNKPTNFQADWTSTIINKPTNFQSDWNTTIINKPTNFQSDWNTTIINKPTDYITSNVLTNININVDNKINTYISSNVVRTLLNDNGNRDIATYITSNVYKDIITPYINSNVIRTLIDNTFNVNTYISSNVLNKLVLSMYKYIITLNNNGADLLNYQFKVSLTYQPEFNATFQDIRIYEDNTLLNTYLENVISGTSADLWIKIPVYSNGKILFLTYGNSLSVGDPNAVFELYDNFSSGTIDTAKWVSSGTIPPSIVYNTNSKGNYCIKLRSTTLDLSVSRLETFNNVPLDSIIEISTCCSWTNPIPAVYSRGGNGTNNYGIQGRYGTRATFDTVGGILNNPYSGWAVLDGTTLNPTDPFTLFSTSDINPNSITNWKKIKFSTIGYNTDFIYNNVSQNTYTSQPTDTKYNTQGKAGIFTHYTGNTFIEEVKIYKGTANIISTTFSTNNAPFISSNIYNNLITPYINSNVIRTLLNDNVNRNISTYITSNIYKDIITPYISSNILGNVINKYLPLSGGTLTGPLTTTTINASLNLQEAGTNLSSKYLQLSGGNITGNLGIGITNPQEILHINEANASMLLSSTAESHITTLFLGTPYNNTSPYKTAIIAQGLTSYSKAKLHFCLDDTANNTYPTYNASVSNARMTITPSGDVGIGSTSPIDKLNVIGSITATDLYIGGSKTAGNNVISSNVLTNINTNINNKINTYISSNVIRTLLDNNNSTNNITNYLPLSGGTLTGLLSGTTINASLNLQEAGTNLSSKYLNLAGGALTGPLTTTTIAGTTINAITNLQENSVNLSSKYLQLSGGTISGILYGGLIYGTTITATTINGINNLQEGGVNLSAKYLNISGNITTYLDLNRGTYALPGIGTFGGTGDRLILWRGSATTHPYSIGIDGGTLYYSVPATSKHSFFINGTQYLTLLPSGNVGISSTSPTEKLDIVGNIKTSGAIYTGTYASLFSDSWGGKITLDNWYFGTIYYNSIYALYGNLNITTNQLSVSGHITSGGNITSSGNITATGAVISTTSTTNGLITGNGLLINAGSGSTGSLGYYGNANAYDYTPVYIGGGGTDICATFNSSIWCKSMMYISSDERIKKNIIDVNDDSALQKILSIQPKIYNYRDKLRGTSNVYGFIAQQIKEVIPEAVSIQKEIIPNIYDLGIYSSNIITTSNINISNILNSSNIVKIYDEYNKEYICNVDNIISSNSFKIDTDINTSNVFIYGSEISDFHTLDKSYIYTLNVCATQQIYSLITDLQNTVNNLQNTVNNLQNKVSILENYISSNI